MMNEQARVVEAGARRAPAPDVPHADAPHAAAWEPRIVAFLCNWCSYAGADLAGGSRLKYPANVRIIRVPCSARMDPKLVLKALEKGADGVLISGCHPGDCHYTEGNYHARRRMTMFRKLTEFIGVDPERVQMSWVSASEGPKWAQVVTEVTEGVRALGPLERMDARDHR